MAEKSYKSSQRGITLGRKIGLKKYLKNRLHVDLCSGKSMYQSRRDRDNTFVSTENFEGT